MDIESLTEFSGKYLSEYVVTFAATLAHPSRRFDPYPAVAKEQEGVIQLHPKNERGAYLSPKLLTFVVISILVGVTINALIPGRPQGPDLLPSLIIILLSWISFGTVAHLISRLIGGHGTFWETLAVSLQLLAVIYVVSCFIAWFTGAITQLEAVKGFAAARGGALEYLAGNPVMVYFMAQLVLMLIYLPLALRHVHGFGWFQQVLVGLLVPVATLFGLWTFLGMFVLGGG